MPLKDPYPEIYNVPEWFKEYLHWLAESPRTVVQAWVELENAGDTHGDDDYEYLEISWDPKDVEEMEWSAAS